MRNHISTTKCLARVHPLKTRARILFAGLASAVLLCSSALQSRADNLILEILNIDLKAENVEGLDVTKDGRLIAVTSPVEEEDGIFQSCIELINHRPEQNVEFHEVLTTDIHGGELTDVAIGPKGAFVISNVRDDDVFEGNQLLVQRGNRIARRIDLPDSADGLALSPDNARLVLAGEKYEAIDIFDTSGLATDVHLLKRIGREEMEPFFAGEEARLAEEDLEPEAVAFSPNGHWAFVSLQEQSSIAIIDMTSLTLVNVVHLPFGFLVDVSEPGEDPEMPVEPVYLVVGVAPDGLGVTPDGKFLITANEADDEYRHLGGISVVDLGNGVQGDLPVTTYCIFDLDPTLLEGSGVAVCPHLIPGEPPTADQTTAIRALPRLDPNSTKTVWRQGKSVTVVNIERKTKAEDRGSVLLLDTSSLDVGGIPVKLDRVLVGLNKNSRPEGLRVSNDGRYIWVGVQLDGGTVTRIELAE